MDRFEVVAADGVCLTGYLWLPRASPRAVLQIAHGAAEHLGRYDHLASRLVEAGYAVIGADHRGHGVNAIDGLGNYGPRGFSGLVDDLRAVADTAKMRFPGAPLVLLGHSMGSFASQVFLARHAEVISALVLSGTAAIDEVLASADLRGMTSINEAFEPARTPFDWLSRDPIEVDKYIADPLCGFELQMPSMATMFSAVAGVRHPEQLAQAVECQIPIYVISGEVDPIVGPEQSSARKVVEDYVQAGLRDIDHRIYRGGRHEMFNEINREEVIGELAEWLDMHTMIDRDQ